MNSAAQYSETWNHKPLADLMTHIVEAHHSFCRRELTRLGSLFKELTARYGKDHPEFQKMAALFFRVAKDLEMHLLKEEQTLFPYIARVEEAVQQDGPLSWPPFGSVENPIRMMVLEHDQTDQELSQIRRLSNGYGLPSGAPERLVALYDGLRAFEQNMIEHIYAEDRLLFPRAIAIEAQACTRKKHE
jgi:regulator of cell morphogenesis and NO signaling